MDFVTQVIKGDKKKVCAETYDSQQFRNVTNVFRLWRITINFLYYFGAIPFKCVFCTTSQRWCFKTSRIQKRSLIIQARSLIMAWIPMSLNEFGVFMAEITEHSKMSSPTAKSYLVLVTKLLAKLLYLLIFRAIFWRPVELMNMLTQIWNTNLAFERHASKSITCAQKLLYFYVGFLLLCRIVVHTIWFVEFVIPDPQLMNTFQLELYKVLIIRFRNRFFMHVSETYTYKNVDYVLMMCEAWLINVSALMWIFWDIIVAAILPVTFQLAVRKFEEDLHSKSTNNSKGDSNPVPVLEICRLFGMLKIMSECINKVWGNICLVLVLYRSTTYAVNMNGWNETEDIVVIIETTIPFISLCLLLYFSGDVYCKVEYFKSWLTEEKNWARFVSDRENRELKRVLVLHESCCVGIGKTGLYRLTYSFSAQVFIVAITIFVISFDN